MPRRKGDDSEAPAENEAEEAVFETSDEDRLPWLEAVEEDEGDGGPPIVKLVAMIVIGLFVIGVVVGGLFWLGNRNRAEGGGELIAAPEGDYKVRPDDPGGMNVAGTGDTAFAASEGVEPQGRLNTTVPERPVTPQAPPQARPQAPAQAPARPAQPAASGATIQLGAFSSQAGATRAWGALAGRFRYLAPLSHSVIPVQASGRTLYRLRASGPDAQGICRRLQIAGEDCSPVG